MYNIILKSLTSLTSCSNKPLSSNKASVIGQLLSDNVQTVCIAVDYNKHSISKAGSCMHARVLPVCSQFMAPIVVHCGEAMSRLIGTTTLVYTCVACCAMHGNCARTYEACQLNVNSGNSVRPGLCFERR